MRQARMECGVSLSGLITHFVCKKFQTFLILFLINDHNSP